MIKTTMNVRIKFAKDNTSNNASVELLVPKAPNNSEMGCTKVSTLPQSTDDRRYVLTREHFELIANERNEKINLYSKDPILLKCEVEPVERVCETVYVIPFFEIKFSNSITRCFKYAPYQEGNLKFVEDYVKQYNYSKKTIYRDIKILREVIDLKFDNDVSLIYNSRYELLILKGLIPIIDLPYGIKKSRFKALIVL